MGHKYTPEQAVFIMNNVAGTPTDELTSMFNARFGTNIKQSQIRAYLKNHGLKTGIGCGVPAGRPTKKYPAEIKNFITENHKGVGPKEMTELLNKEFGTNYTVNQIKAYYTNHNINSGLTGYFTKGHEPWNKGKKGVHTGGKATQFRKGHKPWNYQPIGSERVNGDGYIDIKIADPNKWKGKHILIWEQHNGPVPKGHVVIFGDGNSRNFDPDNLILVSRKQLAVLNKNKLIQNDADLTRTAIIIADLHSKISERKKGG